MDRLRGRGWPAALLALLLAIASLLPSAARAVTYAPNMPARVSIPRLYDRANVFTASEAERIQQLCDAYSWRYRIDVAVLTGTGNTVDNLKDYTDRFYDEYRAAGASTNVIVLTNDPDIRQVRIDVFGEIIPLLPHDGVRGQTLDRVLSCWKAERPFDGVTTFLDGLSGPLEQRADEFDAADALEIPDIVPGQRIYDPAHLFAAEDVAQLGDACTLLGFADFLVVTCVQDNAALRAMLAEGTGKAYEASTGAQDVAVLALDAHGNAALWGSGAAAAFLDLAIYKDFVALGAPTTADSETNQTVQRYLVDAATGRDASDAVRFLLDEMRALYEWRIAFDALPRTVIDAPYLIRDDTGTLSDGDIASLEARAQELYEKRNMRMAVILLDEAQSWVIDERIDRVDFNNRDTYGDDVFVLMASPSIAYAKSLKGSNTAYKKVSDSREYEAISGARDALAAGRTVDACMGYMNAMEKAMRALLPDYRMAENAPLFLRNALGIGLVVALLTLLVLWLMSRGRKPRPPATQTYIVPGSFVVGFSQDRFIASHTTRTARPKDTDSGGGGSSSSNGSRSSGSQGGY